MSSIGFKPVKNPRPKKRGGKHRKGCDELVARTPTVIAERSLEPRDYTHLQRCGRPRVRGQEKCARHLARPNSRLDRMWRRFVRLAR